MKTFLPSSPQVNRVLKPILDFFFWCTLYKVLLCLHSLYHSNIIQLFQYSWASPLGLTGYHEWCQIFTLNLSLLLLQHVFTWGADKWFRRILVWSALAIYLAETAALQWLSGGSVSLLWARRIDWQAPLIGIDVATRCVSVLWLLISPGTQRWLQPPPCCHHRSKMGVTMIKSALKHRLNESNLMYMCVCVCVDVGVHVWVYTGPSMSRLYCNSVYLWLSPPPTHQSLLTNSSLRSRLSCEPTLKAKQPPAVTAAQVLGLHG